MLHDLPRSGGGGGHQIVGLGQTGGCAIIHDKPVFAQHQPVTRLTGLQGRERV